MRFRFLAVVAPGRRFRLAAVILALVSCAGCGYVGPVLPPSPELPVAVANLTVVERGNQLEINFSTPPRTTDNLPIKKFSTIELGIGPDVHPFDFSVWAESARQFNLPPPPPNDPDNVQPVPMTKTLPSADWVGKQIAIAVRTSIKKNGHFSSWSNRVVLNVIPPLQPPDLQKPVPTPKGVQLTWHSEGAAVQYRVLRQGPGEPNPLEIGTSTTSDYVDGTAQYDTPYRYSVVAFENLAESLPSAPQEITPKDIFAPSVPASISALAGPDSIEVSWQRSPEPDLKGYYLYRSIDGSPFERVGGPLSVPAYSDHDVRHGKTYRYEVSSFDQHNNVSDKSAPAQVSF